MLISNNTSSTICIMGFKLQSGRKFHFNDKPGVPVKVTSELGECTITSDGDDWNFKSSGELVAKNGRMHDIEGRKSIAICNKKNNSKKSRRTN